MHEFFEQRNMQDGLGSKTKFQLGSAKTVF